MSALPRWLLAAFAGAILVMVGVGVWFYRSQYQSLQQDTEANLETIAQLKVDQIVQWRKERLADAALFAENPLITEVVADWMKTSDPRAPENLLASFRASSKHPHYQEVALVDTNGHVRLSLSGRRGPLDQEEARALGAALCDRQPVLSVLHLGPGDLTPLLDVIAPLVVRSTGAAETCGAIIFECDACEFLYPLVQSWPVRSASAETLLVRRDGDTVLYLNQLRHQQDTALKLRLPLSRMDLRTPLRAIHGYGRILREDHAERLDGEGRRVLDVISSETQRMGQLIDDLLAFSQLGLQKLKSSGINMTALAQTAYERLAAQAPERALRLDLKPLPPAHGDESMMRVVWDNLLSNAIKFTKPRDIAMIEIGSRREDGQDMVESYRVGVNSYIVKPVDFESFSAAVA